MIFDTARARPSGTDGWLISPDEALVVYTTMCQDPSCDCNEVFAEVADLDADQVGPPLAKLRVGPDGAMDGSGRADLVAELRRLPRSLTDGALQLRGDLRRDHRHRRGFRIPRRLLRSRDLLSWLDYDSHRGSLLSGGSGYIRVDLGGDTYAVDMAICPRPACDCQNVLLRMALLVEDGDDLDVSEEHGLPLDLNAQPLWDQFTGDVELATRVWAAWSGPLDDPAELVRRRYEAVKQLAKRKPLAPKGRPSRNAPCPCGSGKRYKGCCGRG